jgi:uncharacterized membrane protein
MSGPPGWINSHFILSMIERLIPTLLFLAALGCALAAGIFYAFSSLVMRALARIPSSAGIAAMQSINLSVINPWFMAAFFGPAVICCFLAVISLLRWNTQGVTFILAGSALYLVGTMVVTFAFNVPLNDALATVDPAGPEGASQWAGYLTTWTNWNHMRTAAALLAAGSFTVALCFWTR